MTIRRRDARSTPTHKLVTWSVRHYLITRADRLWHLRRLDLEHRLLPQGYLPAQDAARSLLAMELPPGSQLAYTEKVTEEIVARLRKHPEVKSVFVDGGRVPPGTLRGAPRRADHQLHAQEATQRSRSASSSWRSARISKTCRISGSGSSTRTASARCSWS